MGKPATIVKCLRCGKQFWTKPKKIKGTDQYETDDYCQKCRHLRSTVQQKGVEDRTRIRVISNKVNLKREVETLRKIEHYNPNLLEKLRKGEK